MRNKEQVLKAYKLIALYHQIDKGESEAEAQLTGIMSGLYYALGDDMPADDHHIEACQAAMDLQLTDAHAALNKIRSLLAEVDGAPADLPEKPAKSRKTPKMPGIATISPGGGLQELPDALRMLIGGDAQ